MRLKMSHRETENLQTITQTNMLDYKFFANIF